VASRKGLTGRLGDPPRSGSQTVRRIEKHRQRVFIRPTWGGAYGKKETVLDRSRISNASNLQAGVIPPRIHPLS